MTNDATLELVVHVRLDQGVDAELDALGGDAEQEAGDQQRHLGEDRPRQHLEDRRGDEAATTSRRTPHRTLSGGVTAAAATNPAAVTHGQQPEIGQRRVHVVRRVQVVAEDQDHRHRDHAVDHPVGADREQPDPRRPALLQVGQGLDQPADDLPGQGGVGLIRAERPARDPQGEAHADQPAESRPGRTARRSPGSRASAGPARSAAWCRVPTPTTVPIGPMVGITELATMYSPGVDGVRQRRRQRGQQEPVETHGQQHAAVEGGIGPAGADARSRPAPPTRPPGPPGPGRGRPGSAAGTSGRARR